MLDEFNVFLPAEIIDNVQMKFKDFDCTTHWGDGRLYKLWRERCKRKKNS